MGVGRKSSTKRPKKHNQSGSTSIVNQRLMLMLQKWNENGVEHKDKHVVNDDDWARRRVVEAAAVEARLAEREKMRRLERRVARLGDRGGTLSENDEADNDEVVVMIDENEAENEGEWE